MNDYDAHYALSWNSGEDTGFPAVYSDVRTLSTKSDWSNSPQTELIGCILGQLTVESTVFTGELANYMKARGKDFSSHFEIAMSENGETVDKQGVKILAVLDEHAAVPVVQKQLEAILSKMQTSPPLLSEKTILKKLFSNDIDKGNGAQRRRQWIDYRRDEHKEEYLEYLLGAIRGEEEYDGELNEAEKAAVKATKMA